MLLAKANLTEQQNYFKILYNFDFFKVCRLENLKAFDLVNLILAVALLSRWCRDECDSYWCYVAWITSFQISYLEFTSYSINFFCVYLYALNFSDVTLSIFSNVLKNMEEAKPLPEEWLQIAKPFKGDICKNLTFLCYLRFLPSWVVRGSELCDSYFCVLLNDISHLTFTLLHLRQRIPLLTEHSLCGHISKC